MKFLSRVHYLSREDNHFSMYIPRARATEENQLKAQSPNIGSKELSRFADIYRRFTARSFSWVDEFYIHAAKIAQKPLNGSPRYNRKHVITQLKTERVINCTWRSRYIFAQTSASGYEKSESSGGEKKCVEEVWVKGHFPRKSSNRSPQYTHCL